MDDDHILQASKLIAVVICTFVIACWGSCTSEEYFTYKTKVETSKENVAVIGALSDTIAQRLWAVSFSLDKVDHGRRAEDLLRDGIARAKIIHDILLGGAIPEGFELVQTINDTNSTNLVKVTTNQVIAATEQLAGIK